MSGQRNTRGRRSPTLLSQVEKTVTSGKDSKSYTIDLRVHSPGGLSSRGVEGIETAPAVVRLAQVKGLDLIGVTDFYSADFIDEIKSAAEGSKVTVIPGVDLRCQVGSCPDVELSCFFPESYSTRDLREFLEMLAIPERNYGDSTYRVLKSLDEILESVEQLSGAVLPTRIDQTPSRIAAISVLVDDYGFRSFDLAHVESVEIFKSQWPDLKFNLFSFSNANALAQVGSRIAKVSLENPGFEGIRSLIFREPQTSTVANKPS